MTTNNRGGKREGAGRKPNPEGQKVVSLNLHIYPAERDRFIELSKGSTQRETFEDLLDTKEDALNRRRK